MNLNAAANGDHKYTSSAYWSSEWSFMEDWEDAASLSAQAAENQILASYANASPNTLQPGFNLV
jgi:3-hydroxy-3-methylglutaryl CoA synthase